MEKRPENRVLITYQPSGKVDGFDEVVCIEHGFSEVEEEETKRLTTTTFDENG